VLLVEQKVAEALELCDYAYVIERGRIKMSGTGGELSHDPEVQRAYLGVA
jgi:branched-chain amino acid transport system ATP-binding protein